MNKEEKAEECCPKFDPDPWRDRLINWDNKKFIKARVCTFLYMPLNMGSVMKRVMKLLDKTGAVCTDNLMLADHTSGWNMDIYLAVDREVPGAKNMTLSGNYLTRVYEGNFKDTGKWCKDFEAFAAGKSMTITKQYLWYTTCPKCAKKYGKNYVVIVGKTG